jgi:rfaE bifunctional protein nucleotidyltransferase chain/domain
MDLGAGCELRDAMKSLSKIVTMEVLVAKLDAVRTAGKKVVFTNGCFDILHVGHVRYLEAARGEGDLLVVGLNSDASVHLIKGGRRPIINQDQRAEVLASLGCVDFVIVFEEADPMMLIRTLKPDILVKGADWEHDQIVGAEFVESNGGRVVRISLVPDASTSEIIQRIVERYG